MASPFRTNDLPGLPDDPEERELFEQYVLKVAPCPLRCVHDWSSCPYAHQTERAKRRDPRVFAYTGIACLSMKQEGKCALGDSCPYAHSAFEYWLHPTRYHTAICSQGPGCTRKICFFAHSPMELRTPSERPGAFATGGALPMMGAGGALPLPICSRASSLQGSLAAALQQLQEQHAPPATPLAIQRSGSDDSNNSAISTIHPVRPGSPSSLLEGAGAGGAAGGLDQATLAALRALVPPGSSGGPGTVSLQLPPASLPSGGQVSGWLHGTSPTCTGMMQSAFLGSPASAGFPAGSFTPPSPALTCAKPSALDGAAATDKAAALIQAVLDEVAAGRLELNQAAALLSSLAPPKQGPAAAASVRELNGRSHLCAIFVFGS
ncbi:hypothetical protein N2152v2_001255 [Parachlorella kessleri]